MKRSEEIIFSVKTISPKEGDIVIVNMYGTHIEKRLKHELCEYFQKMNLRAILVDGSKSISDIALANDEALKKVGLMRIPNE